MERTKKKKWNVKYFMLTKDKLTLPLLWATVPMCLFAREDNVRRTAKQKSPNTFRGKTSELQVHCNLEKNYANQDLEVVSLQKRNWFSNKARNKKVNSWLSNDVFIKCCNYGNKIYPEMAIAKIAGKTLRWRTVL